MDKKELRRGYLVSEPGTIKSYESFEAKAYFLTTKEGVVVNRYVAIINHNFFSVQLM